MSRGHPRFNRAAGHRDLALPARRQYAHGFTLMEMLVVLVIAGLLMSMLFQSLQLLQRAQARIDVKLLRERQWGLAEQWFADSVDGLYPLGSTPFEGDQAEWQGHTLQPARGTPGAPVRVHWRLRPDEAGDRLIYEAPDQTPLAFPQPAGKLQFAYFDQAGKQYSQWPPSKGLHANLPAAIALYGGGEGGTPAFYRYIAVRGPLQPLLMPFEIEQD